MTAFNLAFGARSAPLRAARNLGLNVANRTPLVRRLCINYASGFAYDLPKLALPRTAS